MNQQKGLLFVVLAANLMLLHSGCNTQPVVVDTKTKIEEVKVGKIIFGKDWKEGGAGNPFPIIDQKASFTPSDSWAYSVRCEEPFGKTEIKWILVYVSENGGEYTVKKGINEVPNPAKHRYTAGREESCQIAFGDKYGKYVLRFFRDETLLAEGEFIYREK